MLSSRPRSPPCMQEWWGINDVIKAHALKLSQHGFRCLVPDLYKGKIGVDKEEAQHVSQRAQRAPKGGGAGALCMRGPRLAWLPPSSGPSWAAVPLLGCGQGRGRLV